LSKPQNYDQHQFAGRQSYPVNARRTLEGWTSPGVAFEDYTRMSTQQRKASNERRLPTPKWAVNDGQLRTLLVTFMEERAGFRKQQKGTLMERLERAKLAVINQRPRLIQVLERLCNEYVTLKRAGACPEMSDEELNASLVQPLVLPQYARRFIELKRKRALEIEIEGIDTYLRYTANGGADVVAAIVYLYYRAGLDSVGVGAELGLKPPHIRQTIWRLHQTAEKIWGKEKTRVALPVEKEIHVNMEPLFG
jgi:hypothetical protein